MEKIINMENNQTPQTLYRYLRKECYLNPQDARTVVEDQNPLTPFLDLGLTCDEAKAIYKSWNHQVPENPHELILYINKAQRYEDAMEAINWDKANNLISPEEAEELEDQTFREINFPINGNKGGDNE